MRCISRRLMVCQEPCHAHVWTRPWLEVGFALVSVRFPLAGGGGTSRIYPSTARHRPHIPLLLSIAVRTSLCYGMLISSWMVGVGLYAGKLLEQSMTDATVGTLPPASRDIYRRHVLCVRNDDPCHICKHLHAHRAHRER